MSYLLIGDSGTVTFERIGTVTGENVSLSNSATKNPVEKGSPITDHATTEPTKLDVSGIATDNSARTTLESMLKNRDLLTYRGVEAYDNLLMTSLSIGHEAENAKGFSFRCSFLVMRIVSAEYVPTSGPSMSAMDAEASDKRETKRESNNGQQTPTNEYFAYSQQFNSNPDVGNGRENPAYSGYGR